MPGGWLPCGWPSQGGDDAAGQALHHEANCSVALGTNQNGGNARGPVGAQDTWSIPGLHPSDIAGAYALPRGGMGTTVAVVDAFDDPSAEADLAVYRKQFGLPPCTTANGCFLKVNQAGRAGPHPKFNAAWSAEAALDVEMVSAVCPQCHILLIEANSDTIDDLGASVDRAVAMGAKAVSNSYYAVEWPGETAEDAHYHHPGVAIVASSGDQTAPAWGGGGDNAAGSWPAPKHSGPYYPATSPYVTSVGGTSLNGGAGAWTETPWHYGGEGCSKYEPRPAFQTGLPFCAKTRAGVDMAAVADPLTGVAVFSKPSGGWVVAGGTSVGAPLVAAAYALSGHLAGPAFSYANPAAFHDIGHPGFDSITGLGSPNGVSGL